MKEFVFRFNLKNNYNFPLRFIDLLNTMQIDYDYYIEDIGTEFEATGLFLVIVIKYEPYTENEEVPF